MKTVTGIAILIIFNTCMHVSYVNEILMLNLIFSTSRFSLFCRWRGGGGGLMPSISYYTAVLIVPGAVKVVIISLSFQIFALLFINLSNSLAIVLLLILPLCRMLFLMRFMPLPPWPPSGSSLRPVWYTKA